MAVIALSTILLWAGVAGLGLAMLGGLTAPWTGVSMGSNMALFLIGFALMKAALAWRALSNGKVTATNPATPQSVGHASALTFRLWIAFRFVVALVALVAAWLVMGWVP